MTVKEMAKMANVCETTVYRLIHKLGRFPTLEEVKAPRKAGRPFKYLSNKETENE